MKFKSGYKAEIDSWFILVVIPSEDMSPNQLSQGLIAPLKKKIKKLSESEVAKARELYSRKH